MNRIIIYLLLFLSCKSDPVSINLDGVDELTRTFFEFNSDNTSSYQDSVTIGNSQRLYSGVINGDSSYTLIKLSIENFSTFHPVCDLPVSYQSPFISLTSLNDIVSWVDESSFTYNINTEGLNIYLSNFEYSWDENIDLLQNNTIPLDNAINLNYYPTSSNSLTIEFLDISYIDDWCTQQDLGIIIEYHPNEEDSIKFIEWHSSNSTINSLRPKINIDYISLDLVSKLSNEFVIESIQSDYSFHYVDNDSAVWSQSWGTFYIMNLDTSVTIEDQLDIYDFPLHDSLSITTSTTESLIQIHLKPNMEIMDSLDIINFSLNNAKAYLSSDPSSDNIEIEANLLWDHIDVNENDLVDEGELYEMWNDYGFDHCVDQYEDGQNGCCYNLQDCTNINGCKYDDEFNCVSAIFDNEGTNENKLWDYIDSNNNGFFDYGDLHETWEDYGLGTVYNIDPENDDYNVEEGNYDVEVYTEGNGIHDPGETCLDFGLDGLPNTLDISENDGTCNSFEQFFDSGVDGIFSINEIGYDSLGTDNNGKWDYIDINGNGFFDFSEDHESWTDTGLGTDYNIDPNGDNYNISSGNDEINLHTEGNNKFDFISNGNSYESYEFWYDYGFDHMSDSLEHVIDSNVVIISLGENDYNIDVNNFSEYYQITPPLNPINSIYLWISRITKDEEGYLIDISLWSQFQLKGLEFKLDHTPLYWTNTFPVFHSTEWSEINSEKLIEDISLYKPNQLEPSELSNLDLMQLNYSDNIKANISLLDLRNFIEINENSIISNKYTNLILPIDTSISNIDIDGAYIYIENDVGTLYGQKIEKDDLEILIPMGLLLQRYISGYYPLNTEDIEFQLRLSGNYNNFSDIYILEKNSYLEVIHTQ